MLNSTEKCSFVNFLKKIADFLVKIRTFPSFSRIKKFYILNVLPFVILPFERSTFSLFYLLIVLLFECSTFFHFTFCHSTFCHSTFCTWALNCMQLVKNRYFFMYFKVFKRHLMICLSLICRILEFHAFWCVFLRFLKVLYVVFNFLHKKIVNGSLATETVYDF